MRMKSLALLLPILVSAPQLIAQEESAPAASGQTTTAPAATVSSSPRQSSQEIRGKQQFDVGLRTGLMYTLVPGIGIEGNYHLSDSLEVGLSYNTGKLNVEAQADDEADDDEKEKTNLDEADLRAQSFGVHARWFPFNSFYVTSGLSHRSVTTEMQISDATNSSNYIKTSTDSKSICFDLGVGNQWSFASGFYIGAEWFGVSAALSSDANADSEVGGVPTSEVEDASDDNKKFAETIGKATSFRIAMLHLGWAF